MDDQEDQLGFSIPDDWFEGAVSSDRTARVKRGKAHSSCAWITGPGSVLLLVEAARDLLEIAALRGMPTTIVHHVRTVALPNGMTLLIMPTPEETGPGVTAITWREGTASLNASDVLIRANIPVESGKQKRFSVYQVRQSKVGPTIAIDMRRELQVKNLAKRRRARKKREGQ